MFAEPGDAGRAPDELIGLPSCPELRPLMFKLELFAAPPLVVCMIGFELDGLCFCCAPDEIRFFEPAAEEPATVLLGWFLRCCDRTFCLRFATPLV